LPHNASERRSASFRHNVVAYGNGFAQLAGHLIKGTHIFVQGELTTREYDRTIQVLGGKKTVDRVIQQLAVELKAECCRNRRSAARSSAFESSRAAILFRRSASAMNVRPELNRGRDEGEPQDC
jgi:single-stranded DNA-binding protein